MPKMCQKYVQHMTEIWPKYAQDMEKIWKRYTQDMPKIWSRHAQDMTEIRPRYAKDMSKICPRYIKDMQKICQRYPKDIPKISGSGWPNLKNITHSVSNSSTWTQEMLAHLKRIKKMVLVFTLMYFKFWRHHFLTSIFKIRSRVQRKRWILSK